VFSAHQFKRGNIKSVEDIPLRRGSGGHSGRYGTPEKENSAERLAAPG
jgi:hypothetical protein